ncbi:exopolysaccharide biosynthesis protein [Alsobacter soli]|nr:exopolysaccharide biosynthesis protein [Alsobacter soli]
MRQGTTRTSDILVRLVEDATTDRVPVRAIVDVLGERAYALLVVVLGLPNCLPMPPPIPLLCGLLLLFVAGQIIVGLPSPWLPKRLLARTIALEDLRKAVDRAVPWLRRLERVARPRLSIFEQALAFRGVGAALLIFSLALVFAAPIIGQIPLGVAVVLVGLGLVERDGIVVIAGLCFGAVGTVLSLGFLFAIIASAAAIF